MNCPKCGTELQDGALFCPTCGANLSAAASPAPVAPAPAARPVNACSAPQADEPRAFLAKYPEYKPLSAWAYFGLSVLYAVPIVGFIFMIIYSFNSSNLNRRSFTRSIWIPFFIALIIALIIVILGAVGVVALDSYY